ncbi:hypothetical protein [uncultured Sphingomonas sp.]|uniref:hypothetical protein n=1 Tax=uncultured Sphingomonas sp. TaxID=158754 RepID=UPI0025E3DE6A|nr:hypothetical protein [uncultured Sphingomonas sp.]
MLAQLVAIGVIPSATADPIPGDVGVPDDCTAVLRRISSVVSIATGLPLGSVPFERHFDPSDRLPYAFDWTEALPEGAKVETVRRISISALGAQYGVTVINDAEHPTLIDAETGTLVAFWPSVADLFQSNNAFSSTGSPIGISMQIATDQSPPQFIEQTAVLIVRQK